MLLTLIAADSSYQVIVDGEGPRGCSSCGGVVESNKEGVSNCSATSV